jgi:predicted NBD/HSP70 family sugar kinase
MVPVYKRNLESIRRTEGWAYGGEVVTRMRQRVRGIRPVDLSEAQLASSETARRINRDIVLELIRGSQPISRADLARRSGLQRSTVSQIVEQLIQEKWVREGSVASPPRGRRPTLLVLNEDLAVIAVDLRPKQATVGTVDLNGRLLDRSIVSITSDPATSTQLITDCIRRMQQAIPGKSIEGIGIALPGRVDPETQQMIFAPNLHWHPFDLMGAVESATGLPVKMENAATACLLAEITYRRIEGVRDIVLVTVSEGVGAGVFADGRLVFGHHGMAGEFGHVPLDPDGVRCGCGRKGCWETLASCNAALRYYKALAPRSRAISFHDLLQMAEEGNEAAASALTQQAEQIGRGLRMIIAGLSPSVVLIAGDITSAWRRFGPVIEKEVANQTLIGTPPRILPTHDGDVARLRGAAALVFLRSATGEGVAGSERQSKSTPDRAMPRASGL